MIEQGDPLRGSNHGQAAQAARATKNILTLFILVAFTIITSLVVITVTFSHSPNSQIQDAPNLLIADHLDFFDTPTAWSTGKLDRLNQPTTSPAQLKLNDTRNRFPRTGTWTSPETQTTFSFTELIPSYNPHCPAETGLRFDIRTRDAATTKWSPWFYLGSWGRTLAGDREIHNDFGKVDVDTLFLNKPAKAYQARVTFFAFNLDETLNPTLRRLAICYSGLSPTGTPPETSPTLPPDFARDIPIPFRAQGNAAKPLRPEICSPTSVSMVMQYLGQDRPTEENALAIYDSEYGLFGNWARAVAWAGENGFDAWLTRFRNFDQVKATIAQGQPIIASIRFKKGECPSFVMQQTEGHLIVIRGVTTEGNFIANDPASREKGNRAIYQANDLAKAWFTHGGVGYIIKRAAP